MDQQYEPPPGSAPPLPPTWPQAAPGWSDQPPATPGVWVWFVVYSIVMAVIYLGVMVMGIVFLVIDPPVLELEPFEVKIMGSIYGGLGFILLIPFAIAPFLPKRKWVWIYDLVLICLGMTSCCTLPACVALLVYWIRPEAKAFFGWT